MSSRQETEQSVNPNTAPVVPRRRFLSSFIMLGLGLGLTSAGIADSIHQSQIIRSINNLAEAAYPVILPKAEDDRISRWNEAVVGACRCFYTDSPEYKNNPQFGKDMRKLFQNLDNSYAKSKMVSKLKEDAGIDDAALLPHSSIGTFGILIGIYLSISGLMRLIRKPVVLSDQNKKTPDRKRVDVPLSTGQSMGQPASLESTAAASDKLVDFIKRNGSAICPVGTSDGSGGELVNEPYQFTDREIEIIKSALQIEKEELLVKQLEKLSALCQMFERYLLKDLVVPAGCKIRFYSLGCGEDGALDAYAMQLVAKRYNVQIEAICVDDNSANIRHRLDQSVVDESARQWQRMAEGGLVDARAAEFIQAPAQSIDFSKGAESQNPLLVVVRNVSPGAWYRILYRGGLRLFPVMEELRNSGSDSRLMVTFDSYLGWKGFILERSEREYLERRAARIPERGPLDEAAQILKFNGKTIHLQYLGDEFQENPIPTADDGWNDKYVTVVGYNH
ncbi:hypothetical protein HYU93_02100 [Candidatus Daviesbacteria bacterium]|nr:hypothetical protein [Candidatus Daviesbacteria bacterium]